MGASKSRSVHDFELSRLNGPPESLSAYAGKVVLAVNVASRCGFTPQYAGLQALYERYSDRGFTVLGFPCNQFFHQEPGTAEEIQEFCSVNFGVTFPLFDKVDVKGALQHPLYAMLTELPDDAGEGRQRVMELREVPHRSGRPCRASVSVESDTGGFAPRRRDRGPALERLAYRSRSDEVRMVC